MTTVDWSLSSMGRTREATVLGRIIAVVRVAAPWAGRALRRTRQVVLYVAGLGCITAAAWTVALPLGLLTAGASLLVLEWLSTPERR